MLPLSLGSPGQTWRMEKQMARGPSSSDPVTAAGPFQRLTDLQMQRLSSLETPLLCPASTLLLSPKCSPKMKTSPFQRAQHVPSLSGSLSPLPPFPPWPRGPGFVESLCETLCYTPTLPATCEVETFITPIHHMGKLRQRWTVSCTRLSQDRHSVVKAPNQTCPL